MGVGFFASVAAREGQIVLEHVLHLVDVGLERLHFGPLAHEGELELEARQYGAKVVADTGEHGGPLIDVRLDAVAHLEERLRCATHLARAARPEIIADGPALAERLGRFREPQDRPDLIAQE